MRGNFAWLSFAFTEDSLLQECPSFVIISYISVDYERRQVPGLQMSGKIFINYRRGDDPGFTQALYQSLEKHFPAADLFMDVEGHIRPGDIFADVLSRQVAACDVFLAVIGPRWIELLTGRSGDAPDFVVIEIKAAIEQGKRVIPILVGGASLPRAGDLPAPVWPLLERNAVALRPERFKADCLWLISALQEGLAAAEQERAARTEAERKAAEAARQQDDAQAAARAKEVVAVRLARAAEGLSPQEVRKAEELAHWNFVRDRKSVQELRDHLARFPGGATENDAMAALDELEWTNLGDKPTTAELNAYLELFPGSGRVAEASAKIASLNREQASVQLEQQTQAHWPIWTAPIVLAVLAIVAGVFSYATGFGSLGKINVTDTSYFYPFSFVTSSMILGFARLKYGRSSLADALYTGVACYLGSILLQLFFVFLNQQIPAAFINISAYFSSALLTVLTLGVAKLLSELVRRPLNLAIAFMLLPALRAFLAPVIISAFGPLSPDTVRSVFIAVIILYTGMLFAWIGYLMWKSQLKRPNEAG
jgi:hypothetical protein